MGLTKNLIAQNDVSRGLFTGSHSIIEKR